MSLPPLDTNVIIRFLTENPESCPRKFRGVYSFFEKLEAGTLAVHLSDLVLFQTYFVLTSFYKVPHREAAEKLKYLIQFSGIRMNEKPVVVACLEILQQRKLDLVDAYLLAWTEQNGIDSAYSFDSDLSKNGLHLLPIE